MPHASWAAWGLVVLAAAAEPVSPPEAVPAPVSPPATVPAPVSPPATVPTPTASAASGQIRGTISYGRKDPAVGAVVVVRPETAVSPIRAATTGTSGTFAFDGLPDGTYRAEVRRDGYIPVVKPAIAVHAPYRAVVEVLLARGEAGSEPKAALDGAASLKGTIHGGGGALLAEARVRLTRIAGGGEDDARMALTDPSGAFAFTGLAAGRWRLEAQGAGLLPLRTNLDLAGDVEIEATLAAQPANYRPLPQDLLVPEEVIPPSAP
jgi:hypothetical protein